MKERILSTDFPFPFNEPLQSQQMATVLGDFGRKIDTHLKGETDFPRQVRVIVNTGNVLLHPGRELVASLINIYSDGASQLDGTFYFDRDIRIKEGIRAQHFLFGREIESITFLSGEEITPESNQA